ncbi:Trypsin alpha-3 [Gryllus bimaculatus]|nr:Trypsin alpha-3 [Gryllus bimaculatus]
MEVARTAVHPDWKPVDQGGNELNDVAVITLRTSAKGYAPATLPPTSSTSSLIEVSPQGSWEPQAAGREALVAGFGEQREGDLNSLPCELHVATVPVLGRVACLRSAIPDFYARQPSLLCAGRRAGGVDTCQGDSGGPLIVKENGKNILIGIVSFGYGCGQPGTPGLYTRVASFLPWIRDQMGQDNRILSGGSKGSSNQSSSANTGHYVPQTASQPQSSGNHDVLCPRGLIV